MPIGNASDQWILEVNGKKFGPYTMAQIHALVQHREIMGEDKVTAPHLSGKWISVSELTKAPQPTQTVSTTPATVPPRPDERTLTSIMAPTRHQEPRKSRSDAILNLFEILQAARERKPQTPSAVGHDIVEMPQPIRTSSGGGLYWFAVPAIVAVAAFAWRMSGSSSTPSVADAEVSTNVAAKPAQTQPVAPKAMTPQAPAPRTAAAPASVKPKTIAALPSNFSAGFSAGRQQIRPAQSPSTVADRDRERERERELEREKEREMEREKERDAEYARSYSSSEPSHRDRERERERETERDQRDRGDRSDHSDRAERADHTDRADRATASVNGSSNENVLPVTGGIPVDPSALSNE